MKVAIEISKNTALIQGKDRYGWQVVDVPAESLTTGQRQTLSEYSYVQDYIKKECPTADYAILFNNYGIDAPLNELCKSVKEPTAEEVRRLLDGIRELKAKQEAENKVKAEAERKAHQAKLAEWQARPLEGRLVLRYGKWEPEWTCGDLENTPAWEEADQEARRRNAEAKAKAERSEAEAKAKAEAGKAALRAWAREHGSELLRAREAGGFEWEGLAQQEYADHVTACIDLPNVSDDGEPTDSAERTTPTLEEIRALDRVNKLLGEKGKAGLEWQTYSEDDDGYGSEPEVTRRCEIAVCIICPDGAAKYRYFLPEGVKQTV